MARGMSKAQKADAYDRVDRERGLLELALGDVMNDAVVFGSWQREEYGKVRCGISRYEGAMGGILISQYRTDGQRDIINVELLEAAERRITEGRRMCESYEALYQAMRSAVNAVRSEAVAA